MPLAITSLGASFQQYRCSAKTESPPDLVDQVAFVRKMKRSAAIREHHKLRRPYGCLRDIKDPALFKMKALHKPVHLAGGDTMGGRFVHLANQLEERLHAGSC